MAALAVLPAMNGEKGLHPFFARPSVQQDTNGTNSRDETAELAENSDGGQNDGKKPKETGRKRKSPSSGITTKKTQKTLRELVNPGTQEPQDPNEYEVQQVPDSCPAEHVDSPRRKRRRTDDDLVGGDETRVAANDGLGNPAETTPRRQQSPQVILVASSPLPATVSEEPAEAPKTPPKKMLKLRASGKLASPISRKATSDMIASEEPRRRERPRKSKEAEKAKQLVVILPYRKDADDFGQKIDRILRGEERVAEEIKATPKKQRTPRKRQPLKPTHPFFLGKPAEELPAPQKESPRKASAVTPGKLRRQTMGNARTQSAPEPVDTWTSALLKDRLMMKHPGAKEAAWPSKEQMHVRGLAQGDQLDLHRLSDTSTLPKRKRKSAKKPLPQEESLLNHFTSRLIVEPEGELREDGFREPHPSLRLPEKLLISGEELAQGIERELSLAHPDDGVDELSLPHAKSSHPALQKLRRSLPDSSTAFDEGRGETFSWTQKYAPTKAAEVLQPEKQMKVLKSWLTSLTVTAVGGTSKQEARPAAKLQAKPKKRGRRKNDELDDFLVDSDEEVRDMDELSEPEDDLSVLDKRKGAKSTVQATGDGVKLSNAVLLSGPHGCGKTAAAYAVAKELGFKVFEISPCERRSGKDVLDKVGDMTENHLVRHHGTDTGETSAAEEPGRNDEAFERDLASGRQGKMSTFFKPNVKTNKASPKKKQPKEKAKVIEDLPIKKPSKDKQQSLILLEEIDILFKDDKDFWATVLKLISTSKRPFIMTCNDEDMVPLQAMTLHAILRFSQPPVELVTDYLLLIAAAEGHLLRRGAVKALYISKGFDLRAAIAELDFWCQMGVGDSRGGLNWIIQRYPPGSDLDEQGRRLRVVSEGIFPKGMGVLPEPGLSEEDQALWAWKEFDLTPTTFLDWENGPVDASVPGTIKTYSRFADALSAADVYTDFLETPRLDMSQPPMPDKARSHYPEGLPLLQTNEFIDYTNIQRQLGIASVFATYRNLHGSGSIKDITKRLETNLTSSRNPKNDYTPLKRRDFACFDAISTPPDGVFSLGSALATSAFDGPLEPIAADLAPYVRSIVGYDRALAEQREQMNGGSRNSKRPRTTRAARSALEGSQRASTRKERWFTKHLDYDAVLATAGKNWPKTIVCMEEVSSREGTETPSPSAESAGTA